MKLLALLFSLITAHAAVETPIGRSPDAKWLADLEKITTQTALTAPDLEKLIRDSQVQSNTTTVAAFLGTVKICDGEGSQAARVNHVSNQQYFFIPRDLDEKPETKPDELIKIYTDKIRKDIPKTLNVASFVWHFTPDTIIAHVVTQSRTICIRADLTPNDAVEVLAHEMVHYTRGLAAGSVDAALRAKDVRDYAEKTVDEPGDEVDAYIEEDSLRIRRHGDKFYYANPRLAAFFNDYGTFVGKREKMAAHILDDLSYMSIRFRTEYRSMLENQLSYENQLLSFNEELLKIRDTDITNLTSFMQSRLRVLGGLWPSYATETQRGRRLLDSATDSRQRLTLEIPKEKQRIETLQARLKGL